MKTKLLLLFISLSLVACKGRNSIKENQTNIRYFIIGQGGGFTGMYEQFKLSEDGIIERFDAGSQEYLGYKQLEKEEAKEIFLLFNTDRLRSLSLDQTGNMNRFIIIPGDKQNGDYRLNWPMEAKVDKDLMNLFDLAWKACKDH